MNDVKVGGCDSAERIAISQVSVGEEERSAVLRVLDSGTLAKGEEGRLFEEEFASALGARHAVAVSSGTAALHLTLIAHGVGRGDEVITSPFTFQATINAILHVGAVPVFVDIDPATFNIVPSLVEDAVTSKTRALLPVHLFGHPCDLASLREIARARSIVLIEDAAQAIGASFNGEPIGRTGTACFSLYATKNITTGEGGMIVTDQKSVAESARMLRSHGARARDDFGAAGFNYRMSEVQAAIGRAQLRRLDSYTEARRRNARYLGEGLSSIETPAEMSWARHAYHHYCVRTGSQKERAKLQERLAAASVDTAIFYEKPAYAHEYLRASLGRSYALHETERACAELVALPVHPGLAKSDLDRIVAAANG